MTDTGSITWDNAVFVTGTPEVHAALLHAPGYPGHFFVFGFRPDAACLVDYEDLPTAPGTAIVEQELLQGAILRLRATSERDTARQAFLARGTSFIQLTARREVQQSTAALTQAGPAPKAERSEQTGTDIEDGSILEPLDALGSFYGCRADHLRPAQNPSLRFLPSDLDLIVDRAFLSVLRVTPGLATPGLVDHCTVFDVVRHHTVQAYMPQARIEWTIASILRNAPRPVRALQQLTVTLPGLPAPQFAITFEDAMAGHEAVPIDGRDIGHDICTINVEPRMRWTALAQKLQDGPITCMRCTRLGEAMHRSMPERRLSLSAATGMLQDPIRKRPHALQFVHVAIRPPTPPVPDDDSLSEHVQETSQQVNREHASTMLHLAEQVREHVEPSRQADEPLRISAWVRDILPHDRDKLIPVTVFDPLRHQTTIWQPADATLAQTIYRVLTEAPCQVALLRFPATPIRHTPGLQVVLTPTGYPNNFRAIPVDGRPKFGAICVIMAEIGTQAREILKIIDGSGRWDSCILPGFDNGIIRIHDAYSCPLQRVAKDEASPLWIETDQTDTVRDVMACIPTPLGRRSVAREAPPSLGFGHRKTISLSDCVPEPAPGLTLQSLRCCRIC